MVISAAPTTYAASGYFFPIIGKASFSNDYNAPRSNGIHHAIDIIANKHQKIISAVSGTVEYVTYPQASWGNAVVIRGNNGNCYWYLHINNDTPGTDDGKGGAMNAFGPDMNPGNPVAKGQLIGYVGDSGNAENTVPHLHFETHNKTQPSCTNGDNPTYNPYNPLTSATHQASPTTPPALPNELLPFGYSNNTAVNVTLGNVNNDLNNTPDTVVAGGKKSAPIVKVYNTHGNLIRSFNPFPGITTTGGVDIATGDIDGDAKVEIVTAMKKGNGASVAIYRMDATGAETKVNEFPVFTKTENNIRVATGDIDGDNKTEIIVGSGVGDTPEVRIFDEVGSETGRFMPYDSKFNHGAEVAAGDITGDNKAEIITGRLGSGSPLIRAYNNSFTKLSEFYAQDANANKGLRIGVNNAVSPSQKQSILVLQNGRYPRLIKYNASGQSIQSTYFMEKWWQGYYDIAVNHDGTYKVGIGFNHRASIR